MVQNYLQSFFFWLLDCRMHFFFSTFFSNFLRKLFFVSFCIQNTLIQNIFWEETTSSQGQNDINCKSQCKFARLFCELFTAKVEQISQNLRFQWKFVKFWRKTGGFNQWRREHKKSGYARNQNSLKFYPLNRKICFLLHFCFTIFKSQGTPWRTWRTLSRRHCHLCKGQGKLKNLTHPSSHLDYVSVFRPSLMIKNQVFCLCSSKPNLLKLSECKWNKDANFKRKNMVWFMMLCGVWTIIGSFW